MEKLRICFESALYALARLGSLFVCLLGELALLIPKLIAGKQRMERFLDEN